MQTIGISKVEARAAGNIHSLAIVSVPGAKIDETNSNSKMIEFSCVYYKGKIKIIFTLHDNNKVNLSLYNIIGTPILSIINENKAPGMYIKEVDASNLRNGIYFVRLLCNNEKQIKKIIIIR